MKDSPSRYVVIARAILLMLFAGLALFAVSIIEACPRPNSAASVATFRTKCAMCHGPDGRGSAVGNRMNVPDLRLPAVQKLPDAELAQVISHGRGGMPSFKDSLRDEQIHALVAYVRFLRRLK